MPSTETLCEKYMAPPGSWGALSFGYMRADRSNGPETFLAWVPLDEPCFMLVERCVDYLDKMPVPVDATAVGTSIIYSGPRPDGQLVRAQIAEASRVISGSLGSSVSKLSCQTAGMPPDAWGLCYYAYFAKSEMQGEPIFLAWMSLGEPCFLIEERCVEYLQSLPDTEASDALTVWVSYQDPKNGPTLVTSVTRRK